MALASARSASAPNRWWRLREPHGRVGRGLLGVLKAVAPTCRSTRSTRPSGSPSCSPTAAAGAVDGAPAARGLPRGRARALPRRRMADRGRRRREAGRVALPLPSRRRTSPTSSTLGSTGVPKASPSRTAAPRRSCSGAGDFGRRRPAGVSPRPRSASTSRSTSCSSAGAGREDHLAEHALALPELEARDEVTLINTVPSAMAGLCARRRSGGRARRDLAGEPLSAALAQRFTRRRASGRSSTSTARRRTPLLDVEKVGRDEPGRRHRAAGRQHVGLVLDACCAPCRWG